LLTLGVLLALLLLQMLCGLMSHMLSWLRHVLGLWKSMMLLLHRQCLVVLRMRLTLGRQLLCLLLSWRLRLALLRVWRRWARSLSWVIVSGR
jgi:hypothetical protein